MATSLTFRNHSDFHRAAIHMAVAGALAGLAAHVAGLAWGWFGPVAGPWGLALVAAAAAYGATAPAARAQVRQWISLIALTVVAGAGAALARGTGEHASEGLMFALPVGLLLARGLGGRRFAISIALGAVAALLAGFVLLRLTTATELASLPAWLVAGGAGAAAAFTLVLGLLPRHIDVVHDRVAEAHDACRGKLSGEIAELADRAMHVWAKVDASLEDGAPVRKAIEDSVVRLFEVAGRWQSIEADGARTPADALVERMESLDQKIARTDDPVAKGQYESARAALAEQIHDLKEIATSRERVVARMHHYLAAMERLRFAVIKHKSADASRLSTEVQPILDDLRDLGRDIDITSEAMGEVEREDAAAAAAESRPAAQA